MVDPIAVSLKLSRWATGDHMLGERLLFLLLLIFVTAFKEMRVMSCREREERLSSRELINRFISLMNFLQAPLSLQLSEGSLLNSRGLVVVESERTPVSIRIGM